jgi:hypothetical protein
MKRLLACVLAGGAIATVMSPVSVLAGEYGAQNLGGSTYLTWSFIDYTSTRGQQDLMLVGYVCVTKDGLASMSARMPCTLN